MIDANISWKWKIVLAVLAILCLSVVGAADFTQDYEYEEDLLVEKSSSAPDNVDPVEFDSLSDSEQQAVIDSMSNHREVESDNLPDEFGNEGYVSINGQMYEYESSYSVEVNEDWMLEWMLSGIFLLGSGFIMTFLLPIVSSELDLNKGQMMAVLVASLLILAMFPIAQFMAFSMDGEADTGKVVYLGTLDESNNATEYSSLSMKQKAYVSTLIEVNDQYSYINGIRRYERPVDLVTDMSEEELKELDTVVVEVNGEQEYHNFVTMDSGTNILGLSQLETLFMSLLSAIYVMLSIVFVVDFLYNTD